MSQYSILICPEKFDEFSTGHLVKSRVWCVDVDEGTVDVYELTSWSGALLEKPPVGQQLNNFPAIYGIRRFIILFTRASHWSRQIDPVHITPFYFSRIHFNIIHASTSWSS
jgi:hypothetical protein